MANPQDTLKELMEKRKKEKENIKTEVITTSPTSIIKDESFLDFSYFKTIVDNEKEQNYLIQKTKELLTIQTSATLELGKILEEVAEHLLKQGSPDGVFEKFLEYNGINVKSARRYRYRYQLYTRAKENIKPIVALLSVREIDYLHKCPEILEDMTDDITLKEAKELLKVEEVKKINLDTNSNIKFSFDYSFLDINYKTKLEYLPNDKKEQVNKLLEKLEKLLNNEN